MFYLAQNDKAWAVDALSISWDGLGLVYAFPPAPIGMA